MFHGIVQSMHGWVRVLTSMVLPTNTTVVEELKGELYRPAFLDHFFPGKFRVTVRRLKPKKHRGIKSAAPYTGNVATNEAIRWSTASYQYMVRIDGYNGWLSAFQSIGLVIGNSKKMSKRLIELVRLTSMWLYRSEDDPLNVEVIKHPHPECFVDGISAIRRGLVIKSVWSNSGASLRWRVRQTWQISTGQVTCGILRFIMEQGMIKGNVLYLPKKMMNGYDIRTFECNIKSEIRTTGWQWMSLEHTYGTLPVKSDDLTHSIYRGVTGLYDDTTLLSTLDGMLASSFADMQSGQWMKWATALADAGDTTILHDKDELDKYAKKNGLIGQVRVAVAELSRCGIPITASQTLMYLMVGSIKNMMLGDNALGKVWLDKSKHWFPVPWAYSAHIYSREVLELFGFDLPETKVGFYHEPTHGFVVPGEFFQENLKNHGGPDFDDTVKVHERLVVMPDGQIKLKGFILRNPNDYGEWSMIDLDEYGPSYHKYTETPPVVNYTELSDLVPQFTELSKSIHIGSLPCMTNPTVLNPVFCIDDERRVRQASMMFPAGVGGTVIPKMIWYANMHKPIPSLCAPNEDIIDALQQGQATSADVAIIQQWIDDTFDDLGQQLDWTLDAFWYHTRMPVPVLEVSSWTSGDEEDSTWVALHVEREIRVRNALRKMQEWLNSNIEMPDVLQSLTMTPEEERDANDRVLRLLQLLKTMKTDQWVKYLSGRLLASDEQYGEEYTDRMVLCMIHSSIRMKQSDTRDYSNYDKWLYAFCAEDVAHPYHWAVRALDRLAQETQ